MINFTPNEVRQAMLMINMAAAHDDQPEIKLKDINVEEMLLALKLHEIIDKVAEQASSIESASNRMLYFNNVLRILKQLDN